MPPSAVVGDVRSPSDIRAAVDEALRHFGGLQAAVAAAGVISGGPPLWEAADAQWDAQFDVNVNGVRNLAAAAVPALLEAPPPRQGRVVAVASAAGLLGLPRLGAYTASKHAAIGLMRSLAADLAGTGITANAVCPGSTADRCSTRRPPSTACPRRKSSPASSWWSASSSRRSPPH